MGQEYEKALELCRLTGADIMRQFLESPTLRIVGGFGHGWEMVLTQGQLVGEVLKLQGDLTFEKMNRLCQDITNAATLAERERMKAIVIQLVEVVSKPPSCCLVCGVGYPFHMETCPVKQAMVHYGFKLHNGVACSREDCGMGGVYCEPGVKPCGRIRR